VLAAAARPVDAGLADRVEAEPQWRKRYHDHVRDLLVAAVATPEGSVASATAGLQAAYERFVHVGRGEHPLRDAVAARPLDGYGTAEVRGAGERERRLTVPYRGERLSGDALHRRLDDWVGRGVVEPSHAEAVGRVADDPDWLDLTGDRFALLGAGAEMSPLRALLRWGATVHAVDLPGPSVWDQIGAAAQDGAGRVLAPQHADAPTPGLDLLQDPAGAREWLGGADGPLTVGNYVYADGAAFARLAIAADAVGEAVLRERPGSALAVLATPTDVFAVPPEAVEHARDRYARRGWRVPAQVPVRALSGRRLFRPNYARTVRVPDGRELGVADVLVVQQGPNYALAKSLQRWRSVSALADGVRVSANVAPPTRTRSVLRNRVLAAAYAGAGRFGIEVFAPATAATLMAAQLVHDLREPAYRPEHPQDLYLRGANHGGLWRVPYEPRSVLGLAVAAGMVSRR
jgi:virulence-associated protein VagC